MNNPASLHDTATEKF